ncbi:MAG: hypothetical protein Q8N63_05295 [Nanoarchaeota archaeon]|nr:hypothetical protein [Nanoarchaeota archaeon]
MQKKTSKITLAIISSLFLMPIISAYGYSGFRNFGYYGSPLDLFQNEWIMFAIIASIFFAAIFYTLFKTFKNKGIAAIISIGFSILISVAIMERGLIEAYGGGEISSWALFLAAAIGVAFLIKFASESFGKIVAAITVFLIWLVLHNFYPEQLLPELLTNIPAFMWFWEWFVIAFFPGLVIWIILTLSFGGKGPKTISDYISKIGNARAG